MTGPSSESENLETWNIFSICYSVEQTIPQVQTYRNQLHQLERLTHGRPQMSLCENTPFEKIPLRYLCGTLYINFQLLWEPTLKIIATHAHGLKVGKFWEVFGPEIREVVKNVREAPEFEVDALGSKLEFLDGLYEGSQKFEVKPDFDNYRVLLWKAMSLFPDVVESKNRDVVELVLDFLR